MKVRRQAALVDLLRDGRVTSQSEAVRLLAETGVKVTQATVSRDLDELGAVRVRSGGAAHYVLLDDIPAFGAPLSQVLRDFVVAKEASGNLAVLRTPPGHANVVAAALDRATLEGVLGTVAGDDTLFVCGDEDTRGRGVLKILEKIERGTRA